MPGMCVIAQPNRNWPSTSLKAQPKKKKIRVRRLRSLLQIEPNPRFFSYKKGLPPFLEPRLLESLLPPIVSPHLFPLFGLDDLLHAC